MSGFDTFVSYARVHSVWARRLAQCLRAHGLTVFMDTSSLRRGRDFPDQIAEAAVTARAGVSLVSRAYNRSDWCRRERNLLFADAAKVNFVARLEKVAVPAIMKAATWLDEVLHYPLSPADVADAIADELCDPVSMRSMRSAPNTRDFVGVRTPLRVTFVEYQGALTRAVDRETVVAAAIDLPHEKPRIVLGSAVDRTLLAAIADPLRRGGVSTLLTVESDAAHETRSELISLNAETSVRFLLAIGADDLCHPPAGLGRVIDGAIASRESVGQVLKALTRRPEAATAELSRMARSCGDLLLPDVRQEELVVLQSRWTDAHGGLHVSPSIGQEVLN